MTGRFFRACLVVMLFTVTLTGCETAKKMGQVISNPNIQVGDLKSQPSEVTVTLLTEPQPHALHPPLTPAYSAPGGFLSGSGTPVR